MSLSVKWKKKKKRQVFPIWMWLCALIYLLSLRRKRKKKPNQNPGSSCPKPSPCDWVSRVVLFSLGSLRLLILLVGKPCNQFVRITVSCGNETDKQAAEECVLGIFQVCSPWPFRLSWFDLGPCLGQGSCFQHLGLSSSERAKNLQRVILCSFREEIFQIVTLP